MLTPVLTYLGALHTWVSSTVPEIEEFVTPTLVTETRSATVAAITAHTNSTIANAQHSTAPASGLTRILCKR